MVNFIRFAWSIWSGLPGQFHPDFTTFEEWNSLVEFLGKDDGQVEGQVNRIKNIKRMMYGRASFELLRKMILINSA